MNPNKPRLIHQLVSDKISSICLQSFKPEQHFLPHLITKVLQKYFAAKDVLDVDANMDSRWQHCLIFTWQTL